MSNETKIITSKSSPTEVYIDGKSYTLERLRSLIKFYNDHQIERGQRQCPLCESYYDENGMFVCDECGNLLYDSYRCKEHDHDNMTVCIDCCARCAKDKAYEDAVNQAIDIKRGK